MTRDASALLALIMIAIMTLAFLTDHDILAVGCLIVGIGLAVFSMREGRRE